MFLYKCVVFVLLVKIQNNIRFKKINKIIKLQLLVKNKSIIVFFSRLKYKNKSSLMRFIICKKKKLKTQTQLFIN